MLNHFFRLNTIVFLQFKLLGQDGPYLYTTKSSNMQVRDISLIKKIVLFYVPASLRCFMYLIYGLGRKNPDGSIKVLIYAFFLHKPTYFQPLRRAVGVTLLSTYKGQNGVLESDFTTH